MFSKAENIFGKYKWLECLRESDKFCGFQPRFRMKSGQNLVLIPCSESFTTSTNI